MIEERELVDRAIRTLEPDAPSLEGMLRRRDRVRRNRRIGSALLAIAVALAAIGGLVRIFEGSSSHVPAAPSISSKNVGALRQQWSAQTSGGNSFPTVVGDSVLANSTDHVQAYPISCRASCSPTWVADVSGGSRPGVTVSGDRVYAGSGDGHVYVFDLSCATGGANCRPIWSIDVGGNVGQPIVADGRIFATTKDPGQNLRVLAYQADCGDDGGRCRPIWQGSIGEPGSFVPVVRDGFIFLGNGPSKLTAFAVDCGTHGATCKPAWVGIPGLETTFASAPVFGNGLMYELAHRGVIGIDPACLRSSTCRIEWQSEPLPGYPPVLAGTTLYLATVTTNELYAFDATKACGTVVCGPMWSVHVPAQPAYGTPLVVGDVVFVATTAGRVYAYPATCPTGSCDPLWSGTVGTNEVRLASDGHTLFAASEGQLAAYAPSVSALPRTAASSGSKTGSAIFYLVGAAIGAGFLLAWTVRRRRARP